MTHPTLEEQRTLVLELTARRDRAEAAKFVAETLKLEAETLLLVAKAAQRTSWRRWIVLGTCVVSCAWLAVGVLWALGLSHR
jgi:hypothetical protein